jgi:ATP-dependent DNA ligase
LTENEINKILNLNLNALSKIHFRFKNRLSLEILNNANERLAIDITIIQSTNNPNEIYNVQKTYELELDYSIKKSINLEKISDTIIDEIIKIKKVLESTINILSKIDQTTILDGYKKVIFLNDNFDFNNTLYTMQPISAEVQHIVDKIPNKYSVTDKTDGNKYSLFVFNNIIYLISTNLNIIKTNYNVSNLNNTILEGELIYLAEQQKYLFLAFDCLYYNDSEIKTEVQLNKRLSYVTKFCKEINKESIYEPKQYDDTFSLEKQEKFYFNELKKFYKKINNLISNIQVNEIVIHPKLFIFPQGGDNSEVFLI